MKTLADRIMDVRQWMAPHVAHVPGSSSYIMQLDGIAHELLVAQQQPQAKRRRKRQ
jgi:hypothetical protein